jgi:hypothetical protein
MLGGRGKRFGTAADLKESQQFLFVALRQVTAEKRTVGGAVSAQGPVNNLKARERIMSRKSQEPGQAEAQTLQILAGKVFEGNPIVQQRRF